MKEKLAFLYGEYHTLREASCEWLEKRTYDNKMNAIMVLLGKMPYDISDPIDSIWYETENIKHQFMVQNLP